MLSQRRAQATLAYIKPRISNPGRLTAKGYGERQLAVNCPCEPTNDSDCSEEQHQLNRRTEFKVLSVGTRRAEDPASVSNSRVEQSTAAPSNGSNTPSNSKIYVVQENETLYRIALRFSLTVEELKALNGLESDLIRPGQILKIG